MDSSERWKAEGGRRKVEGGKRRKVLFAFGTRPEAIKLAPVINELRRYPERFNVRVVVTAQHREMLDQVLSLFKIKPDYDLGVMREGQSLSDTLVHSLRRLEPVMKKEQPEVVLVQGDATSAFASALAAYYHKIPVAHIEAGLRTLDKFAPFPEEVNRRFITIIADWHFAPTLKAKENLLQEGVPESRIYVTGNTVIDALLWVRSKVCPERSRGVKSQNDGAEGAIANHRRLILVTLHRRESFGKPLKRICRALVALVKRNPDVIIVYPVHPNPSVRKPVKRFLGGIKNIRLVPPLDYRQFVELLEQAYLVLTDSGGVQEEAPSLGKPVLVLREKTERPEILAAGCARLVGTDPARIITATEKLLRSKATYQKMAQAPNPYGDGKAAKRIRQILAQLLRVGAQP